MTKSKAQIDSKIKLRDKASRMVSHISFVNNRYKIRANNKTYTWSTNIEKIDLIRNGLPYTVIETISKLTKIPLNQFLNSLEIIQSTYVKKKKSKAVLGKRKSESIMELVELFDYGLGVFNNEEEKFQRWLQKPNIALTKLSPKNYFDTMIGITEVKKALNRIEHGNMA